jgi:hypothetical protein
MAILQSALRGWFNKGRSKQQEALELLRQERENTQKRLDEIVSRLDGEDLWFYEQDVEELRCACVHPEPQQPDD